MSRLREQGDTIVEVLLAISIAGLVLITAYQSVGRSTRAIQDSQEHSQGIKLAEDQLEFLRQTGSIDTAVNHCFKPDGTGPTSVLADCKLTPYGPSGVTYTIAVTKEAASTNHYDVQVDWDSLLGGHAQIVLYYHPPERS